MTFRVRDVEVTCCGDCPMNKSFPNGLSEHPIFKHLPISYNVLPPTHRCTAAMDTTFLNSEGRIIFIPNSIPSWCPLA